MDHDEVNAVFTTLDPIILLSDMRLAQQRLVDLADKDGAVRDDETMIEEFLAGLRTVRMTASA